MQTGSIIRTVTRRGYLFFADDPGTGNQRSDPHPAGRSAPGSGKPSILVLPFANLSDDPVQAYLSVGFSQDIATELSRFTHLAIKSPRLAAHLRSRTGSGTGRETSGQRPCCRRQRATHGRPAEVSVRLSDAAGGTTIWSERYDSDLTQIFDLQDAIVASIAGAVEGKVVAAIAHDTRRRPTESWTAMTTCCKGAKSVTSTACPRPLPISGVPLRSIPPSFRRSAGWRSA